jgi:hypothetical protein
MNPWITHLKAYRRKHPRVSLKQAMKSAKKTYTKKRTTKRKPRK